MRRLLFFSFFLAVFVVSHSQVDSTINALKDTIKEKVIDESIPKKTIYDKFMYPHRWYVKQLLKEKSPAFDTTYIKNNKRRLTLAIPVSKKFYSFSIIDLDKKKRLIFSPNNYYHVGINFSNIILTFGFVPGIKFGAKEGHGKTKTIDIQATVIGKRVITDLNYQAYRGFYVYNTRDYKINELNPDTIVIRPDVNITSFGVNSIYVFNNKNYSLRGAFSFTDIQLKSAGSFLAGIYHSHLAYFSNDSTFVRHPFMNDFSPLLSEINQISQISAGVMGGYGYTFVYKRISLSMALTIGAGGQKTYYKKMDGHNESFRINLLTSINAKSALRYDNRNYFVGLLATYDNSFAFNTRVMNVSRYLGRMVAFVGYRFDATKQERKVLKWLKLIDYN